MHGYRDYVEAAGLMSYGANLPDLYQRCADYVDKILRGANPGDMPVEQPTKFESDHRQGPQLDNPRNASPARQRTDRVRMLFAAPAHDRYWH